MAKRLAPEPIVEALAIAVPPERAWEALGSPRVLGDLVLGHVEMDTRPGQPFVWQWGVWVQAAPTKGDATWRGTVLDAVPGSTLVLGGGGTSVVFTVKGTGGTSLVTVVQGSAPPRVDIEGYRYGWADWLLKLKTLLERPPGDSLYLRTLVRATPAEILRAWLSPTAMGKILPGEAKIAAKTGGRFEWRWKRPPGAVDTGAFLEIDKARRIVFTWEGTLRTSEVRLEATRTPYGTLVSLEHAGGRWPQAARSGQREKRRDSRRLWAHLLERLRVYFYYGKKIRTT